MIQSFVDDQTAELFQARVSRRWSNIKAIALRKLDMLHAAVFLNDLRIPPGNRLEAPGKGRKGRHSIRINDQYRICFVWRPGRHPSSRDC